MPEFSIIVPSYNRANELSGTINFVIGQSFADFELIIVDDGSTDDTRKVVEMVGDNRIRYIYQKNQERAVARNTGIRNATGKYVTFLDSDDVLFPNFLQQAYELVRNRNQPPWMHINYEVRSPRKEVLKKAVIRKGELDSQLVTGNHLSCLGVFVRSDIIKRNCFDEDRRLIGSEDYDLWLRLAKQYPLIYTNESCAAIVHHRDRSVMNFGKKELIGRVEYLIDKVKRSGLFEERWHRVFEAHRFMYLALHLTMGRQYRASFIYFLKAVKRQPLLLLSNKALGYFKVFLSGFGSIRGRTS